VGILHTILTSDTHICKTVKSHNYQSKELKYRSTKNKLVWLLVFHMEEELDKMKSLRGKLEVRDFILEKQIRHVPKCNF
jgi:hypothetical protein